MCRIFLELSLYPVAFFVLAVIVFSLFCTEPERFNFFIILEMVICQIFLSSYNITITRWQFIYNLFLIWLTCYVNNNLLDTKIYVFKKGVRTEILLNQLLSLQFSDLTWILYCYYWYFFKYSCFTITLQYNVKVPTQLYYNTNITDYKSYINFCCM